MLDKTPKKFEDEETRRKMGERVRKGRRRSGQRANVTSNPSSIVTHLRSSSETLFSFSLFHCFIIHLILTMSVLHVSISLYCLYLLSSRFSFPLLSVLVSSSSLCSAFRCLTLSIHWYVSSLLLTTLHRFASTFCSSMCSCVIPSLYASLGNGAEGGQRASTH